MIAATISFTILLLNCVPHLLSELVDADIGVGRDI